MSKPFIVGACAAALAALAATCLGGPSAMAQSAADTPAPPTTNAAPAATEVPAAPPAGKASSPSHRNATSQRQVKQTEKAKNYYVAAWGVDKLSVRYTASGNLIRFSYRVADPERAKTLADKSATPYLVGQRSRAVLQVPVMEKVGPLRQSMTPQAGQEYWMVFSNKGNLVKPGDRVSVLIGKFRADGLMVE